MKAGDGEGSVKPDMGCIGMEGFGGFGDVDDLTSFRFELVVDPDLVAADESVAEVSGLKGNGRVWFAEKPSFHILVENVRVSDRGWLRPMDRGVDGPIEFNSSGPGFVERASLGVVGDPQIFVKSDREHPCVLIEHGSEHGDISLCRDGRLSQDHGCDKCGKHRLRLPSGLILGA